MYNVRKYSQDFEKGKTIMKSYGNPQLKMCHIGGFLSEVYNDACLQNIATGEPKPGNLMQIHDEIMKKLECMAHTRWRDACIGGYPIPFCCETATLTKMYTTEELHTTGIITTAASPEESHVVGWEAGSELKESDIMDTKGIHNVIEESMDTKMVWQMHTTLMITTDRKKLWLDALIKEQDHAVRQVQEWHLEEVQAIIDVVHCWEDGLSGFWHHWTELIEQAMRVLAEFISIPW